MSTDEELVYYVRQQIHAGYNIIEVPSSIINDVSEEAKQAIRELCEINEVEIVIVAG